MARYNTVNTATTSSGTATFSTPTQGLLTTLTGVAPYTVTLAMPAMFTGITQSFFNNTGGVVTLTTPSGNILGAGFSGAVSQTIPANATYTLTSDGTNYVIVNNEGGPISATTLSASGTVTLSPTTAGVSINPANGNVVISPTGTGTVTINPAVTGSINKVNIGASTAGDATFNTITLNTTLTGTGTIDGGTF
jgi:hypothetical protein